MEKSCDMSWFQIYICQPLKMKTANRFHLKFLLIILLIHLRKLRPGSIYFNKLQQKKKKNYNPQKKNSNCYTKAEKWILEFC